MAGVLRPCERPDVSSRSNCPGNRNRYTGWSGGGSNRYWKRNLVATRDRDGGGDTRGAVHSHLSAAQWQLLQALRLYEEGEDYFSVIALAGAAEEIFGRLSRKMGLGCSLGRLAMKQIGVLAATIGQRGESRRLVSSETERDR